MYNNVDSETRIISDGWKDYIDLKQLFSEHQTVNHSLLYKDRITNAHTNTIEGSWMGLKMHIPPGRRTKSKLKTCLVRYMIIKTVLDIHF